jgi:hypothetical protein
MAELHQDRPDITTESPQREVKLALNLTFKIRSQLAGTPAYLYLHHLWLTVPTIRTNEALDNQILTMQNIVISDE